MSIFQGGEVVRILVIGSGGREHALVWKLKQSPRVSEVFVAPGNGGTAREGAINVAVDAGDLDGLVELARKEKIDLVVPGPELPLTLGIVDAGVYSAAVAKVWLMDGADNAWIFLLVFICDLGCSVLGSIVNYKDLYFISAW